MNKTNLLASVVVATASALMFSGCSSEPQSRAEVKVDWETYEASESATKRAEIDAWVESEDCDMLATMYTLATSSQGLADMGYLEKGLFPADVTNYMFAGMQEIGGCKLELLALETDG